MRVTSRHLLAMAIVALLAGCIAEPPPNDRSVGYRSVEEGEPSSGERGNMTLNEMNFAGSVKDDGTYDPDDVFIELWNRHPRPINISRWHVIVEGDVIRTLRLPTITDPIPPNGFFVIAAKADGAFGASADLIVPELQLGKGYNYIEIRDNDLRLMENAGSLGERVFAGGYDLVRARSMERNQVIFANIGSNGRNWHAYSMSETYKPTVAEGYQKYTMASPGVANSPDYSGFSSGGSVD
jgi:hypothetical protein